MAFDFGPMNEALRNDFAEEVIITPGEGPIQIVSGIREDPATLESISPGAAIAYWFKVSDLDAIPLAGDLMTIADVDYEVIGEPHQDAGGGITVPLILKR